MDKEELRERYEANGDEADFIEAKRLYEEALAEGDDAQLLNDYGYLLQCHGRYSMGLAVAQYERAIELDPGYDKPHYQLIGARAALGQSDRSIAYHAERLTASPTLARHYRFLANAHLAAHQFAEARVVADAGLVIATDDAALLDARGSAKAGSGDPEGALADWRHALERDPENLSPVYSSAFLLEREGRLEEALAAWRFIVDWCDARGFALTAEWPQREIDRIRAELQPVAGGSNG